MHHCCHLLLEIIPLKFQIIKNSFMFFSSLLLQILGSLTELQPSDFFTTEGAEALALQVVIISVLTPWIPFSSSYDLSPKPSSARLSAGLIYFSKVILHLICVFATLSIRYADRIGL